MKECNEVRADRVRMGYLHDGVQWITWRILTGGLGGGGGSFNVNRNRDKDYYITMMYTSIIYSYTSYS